MSLHDTWHDWLGPAADIVTDDEVERLDTAARAIQDRWPKVDDRDSREQALSAAAQVILGDADLEAIAERWHAARVLERDRHADLTGALIAAWTGARSGPGSEADLMARSGASRLTVRKAVGRGGHQPAST